MAPGERQDAALYCDTAAEAERLRKEAAAEKRRLAAAAKKRKAAEAAAEAGGGGGEDWKREAEATERAAAGAAAAAETAAAGRAAAAATYYKVTVRDNGKGMSHDDIPNMLGIVLSGTKYGVRQARGKFGLGAKMALIWAKQTTGVPVEVSSCVPGGGLISSYTLDINLQQNRPDVQRCEKLANPEKWHGTQISCTIRGAWTSYRSRILTYLRQLAIITPYAELSFRFKSEGGRKGADVGLRFRRRTTQMPATPSETAYHPSAVDLELIRTLARRTRCPTLRSFLCKEFICVDSQLADRLVREVANGVTSGMDPKQLSAAQSMALHRLFREAKFEAPPADCLSPAGEYNMRLGVVKEMRPELVATYCGSPGACEGHPFMVEAAVSLGGRQVKAGLNVFRFANRIPLLFEPGSDVIVRQAQALDWSRYKIDPKSAHLGVFVSIVSTRIPFRGAGKEHIAEDVGVIAEEVKKALQTCALQLAKKLAKRQEAKKRKARAKAIKRYVPDAARAIFSVLSKISAREEPAEKRRRLAESAGAAPGEDLVGEVGRREVTEASLRTRLEQHVEAADADAALEGAMAAGRAEGAASTVFMVPLSVRHTFGGAAEMAGGASFRLLL